MFISGKRARLILIPTLTILIGAAGLAYSRRLSLLVWLLVATSPGTVLDSVPDSEPGVEWYDDWFTVEHIDAETIAIGEPRYWQKNYNYLILGDSHAILFDTGPGVRDIRQVVDSLTDLPLTVACSHLHYDHIGAHGEFDSIVMLDSPDVRVQTMGSSFSPTARQFLGDLEGRPIPTFKVTEFWSHEQEIDLGGRILTVLHTPGHSPESMMLFDRARNQLFTGDMIYPGQLFAMLETSSMPDYLASMTMLSEWTNNETLLLGAHASLDGPNGTPRLNGADLVDLRDALTEIKNRSLGSTGFYPRVYSIGDQMSLFADFPWEQNW